MRPGLPAWIDDKVVNATLDDSEAARDLAAMLPLSIDIDDHLRRETTGAMPKPLSERTPGSRTYERGDLGYWRPRNTFVIFCRQDGLETVPRPSRYASLVEPAPWIGQTGLRMVIAPATLRASAVHAGSCAKADTVAQSIAAARADRVAAMCMKSSRSKRAALTGNSPRSGPRA
jgi:hypothetical protein